MRLLLVEDSKRLQRSIGKGLKKEGHVIDISGDGNEGLWLAESNEYDVLILDLMLPGLDGLSILTRLREKSIKTPVLILTAKDTVEDRVRGLNLGSDDYLIKPFAFDELIARIEALGRRGHGVRSSKIKVDTLVVDTTKKEVSRAGNNVELTPREYKVLEFLALKAGDVVTRTDIETHIYDENADMLSNVIDSTICSIRKKIDLENITPVIHTRRGLGYVLKVGS